MIEHTKQSDAALHPKLVGSIRRLAQLSELPAGATLGCMISLHKPGYIPAEITVLKNIGPMLVRANIIKEKLESVLSDPLVKSLSIGQRIFPAS
jgi:hypothetical protein